MPAVRHTPKRRRMDCPECGRDVSYTLPWVPGDGPSGLVRDYGTRVLKDHYRPGTQDPCPVNGPSGRGVYVPRSQR